MAAGTTSAQSNTPRANRAGRPGPPATDSFFLTCNLSIRGDAVVLRRLVRCGLSRGGGYRVGHPPQPPKASAIHPYLNFTIHDLFCRAEACAETCVPLDERYPCWESGKSPFGRQSRRCVARQNPPLRPAAPPPARSPRCSGSTLSAASSPRWIRPAAIPLPPGLRSKRGLQIETSRHGKFDSASGPS
jgi:hypothetical protein